MSNTPVEVLEAKTPVQVEEYGFAPDSGGPGRFRGRLGLVREYRLLADEAVLQLRADRQLFRPFGLAGNDEAAPTRNVLNPDAESTVLPGKVTTTLRRG